MAESFSPNVPAYVFLALRKVGLFEPDAGSKFHCALVQTVADLGESVPEGVLFTRLQYVAGQEKAEAVRELKLAELELDHERAKFIARLQNEKDFANNRAEAEAKADPEIKRLAGLVVFARYRVESVGMFLETLRREVDVWRTVQANEREADRMAVVGFSGRAA